MVIWTMVKPIGTSHKPTTNFHKNKFLWKGQLDENLNWRDMLPVDSDEKATWYAGVELSQLFPALQLTRARVLPGNCRRPSYKKHKDRR